VAATLARMPKRETHLICGMLNTKDVSGYMAPLAPQVTRLHAVSIPGEKNTLPAEVTRDAAASVGMDAVAAGSVAEALSAIAATSPEARVLICGSLYLAGAILRENG
jgi:dihydrofolate synthase/folylpolyglutamate synthase